MLGFQKEIYIKDMDCYILPGRYRGRLDLSIMRHCEDKVGVSRAVLNIPVSSKN